MLAFFVAFRFSGDFYDKGKRKTDETITDFAIFIFAAMPTWLYDLQSADIFSIEKKMLNYSVHISVQVKYRAQNIVNQPKTLSTIRFINVKCPFFLNIRKWHWVEKIHNVAATRYEK